MWRGVVWCSMVWCGLVWCGVVWCGLVWCGVCGVVWCVVWVVWFGVVSCGVVWCGMVCCGVWCGVTWWCGVGGVVWRCGESVEKESGKCVDLNAHRPALIQFIYARVSTPVQGLWLACLIAAVFSIFAFCGLMMSTKHLKSYAAAENESREADPISSAGKLKSNTNPTGNSRDEGVLSQNMAPSGEVAVEPRSGQIQM
ncbi:hypothetical protein Y032_0002g909 [Ancylostoma ceylanicum]|uniref:Uncharacterized protein n=2 Tax=Ancylostoma ceylanicum TaxID=53326 RepID=A0A016W3T3_9BILA|nr:hypothetical protein Y032_0002g909 [Ancylostoma ceylanicum]